MVISTKKRKSQKVFVIHEYKNEILIEEAFEAMKKTRLSTYRLAELEEYVNKTIFINQENWGYLLQKKERFIRKFNELEDKIGITEKIEKYEEFNEDFPTKMELKELVQIIKDYLILNADMEELLVRMLRKISDDLRSQIYNNIDTIDNDLVSLQLYKELKTKKIFHLNRVSTDYDKQVTHFINTKDPEMKNDLNKISKEEKIIKVKDFTYAIDQLYEEIAFHESTLFKIIETSISNENVKQMEKNNKIQNKINKKLFWLTVATFVLVTIQTIVGILSLL